ncbi:mutator type transposase [Tanacetum coccineum]
MHTCYNIQSLEMNMKRIKKLNPEMYNWLKDIPPQHWARKTSLCDGIIEKSTGPLTPNATKLFNLIKRDAAQYKVIWNGGDLYDTTGPYGDKCVVNIRSRSCACRKWEITGMPCKHAVASIWNMANNGLEPGIPESWVHENTPITLTAPNYKPPIGRPKKKRRKSAAEIYDNLVKRGKLSRAGGTVTCLKCGQQGHNQRSCKGQRHQGSHAPPQASQASSQASQAPPSSSQDSQAPPSSSQASQVFTRFTKSTAKFVPQRPATTKKNGSNAKGKQ